MDKLVCISLGCYGIIYKQYCGFLIAKKLMWSSFVFFVVSVFDIKLTQLCKRGDLKVIMFYGDIITSSYFHFFTGFKNDIYFILMSFDKF